jgi:glutaredoxin/glutathione-dependent peroxiredoxin
MEIGSTLPNTPVQQLVDGEVLQINLAEFSAGKTVLLVSLPGAFTPTCSDDHVPGYLSNIGAFRDKGVDEVVILATSDFFVVKAWADQLKVGEHLHFMADGSQKFAAAAGQLLDLTDLGLGMRSQRYAALVRDGQVEKLAIEPDATSVSVSSAAEMLQRI